MQKRPAKNKGVWYILDQIVWKVYQKAIMLVLPEDVELVEDLLDLEMSSLPLSQIRKVRITGTLNRDTREFTPHAEVELEASALAENMHIAHIKLPVWLGKKNDMTPVEQEPETEESDDIVETKDELLEQEESVEEPVVQAPEPEVETVPDTTDEDEEDDLEW